jgi:hypothetical protein
MFNKLYDWHRDYARKHPLMCHFIATAFGVSLIWSAGYVEALRDSWWITASSILGIIVGLELIHTGISCLDDTDF